MNKENSMTTPNEITRSNAWNAVDEAVDEYIDGYEFRGDPGDHIPTEFELFLITDAIGGLLSDAKILVLIAAAAPVAAQPQPSALSREGRWCPDKCPITGRSFFMWIEHHKTGEMVPTYGGPYDSYTLPEHDGQSFRCERYDHDAGGWMDDAFEDTGLTIANDQALVIDPENPRYEEIEAFATAQPQPSENATSDDTMERALAELVDKIVPGLDTGDLVADAATASKALSAQSSGDAGEFERIGFESWAESRRQPRMRNGDGYDDFPMDWAWKAWKARAALAAQAETPVDDKAHPRFQAGYAAGMKDHLLNAKTDDQLGGLLAAIQYFGTTKWEEGKGIAPPNLITVRKAWDEVYEKVQALAAHASGQNNFYATVNAVIIDLLDAETAEQIMNAIDAARKAKEGG